MESHLNYKYGGYEIQSNPYEYCVGCNSPIMQNEEVWEIKNLWYCEHCMLELESKNRSLQP